jgi:hypothetical protein
MSGRAPRRFEDVGERFWTGPKRCGISSWLVPGVSATARRILYLT